MARREVELTHFCARLEECPAAPWPEVALSGRSNVGKSSLVNLLTGRRAIAHISKHPGKTRCFTYYTVDGRWNLVDMPGYGYARVSPEERRRWATAARRYFHGREQLRAVVQLVDVRVGATPDDKARLRELVGLAKPLCLAFTKADKVARHRHDRVVGEVLGSLGFGLPPRTGVVITSAAKGFGQDELWAWIEDHVTSGPAVGRRRPD